MIFGQAIPSSKDKANKWWYLEYWYEVFPESLSLILMFVQIKIW